MLNPQKSLFKDYQNLLIRNEYLEEKNREVVYQIYLLQKQVETLENSNQNKDIKIKEQEDKINIQEREIQRLQALLQKDGTNSSIPTSQTPINKNKVIPNTREKSDRKRGGQEGHKKHKLEYFKEEEINEVVEHSIKECPYCNSKEIKEIENNIKKDESDFKIVVIKRRHKFPKYKCKKCGKTFHERIPNCLKEENQYGPQIQTLELTLMNQANVTINKAKSITYGLTDGKIELSEGYIAKLQKSASKELKKFKEELRKEIIKQKLIHWDDTVIRINTKRGCLRFYGTEKLGLYYAHTKKDKNGLDEDTILKLLPKETIVVHDHNKVNYNEEYGFTNAECNRHLIGDLKGVIDNLKHEWSKELIDLLCETNKERERLIERGERRFTKEYLKEFNERFDNIMLKAMEENTKDEKHYYSGKEKTLIIRILDYKEQYILWVYDFEVPFTNNLSERGLRDVISKMKAAGQFWNVDSASWYADIKSYIETCKKNDVNVYNALLKLSIGKPYTLNEILNHKVDL